MDYFIGRICRGLEYLIAAALAAMVLLVFGNVVMRYVFNSGIMVSEEVSRWLFLWGTFLGALVALRDRAHLGVDMVLDRLPAWGKQACLVLVHVMMLAILGMLFSGSLQQVKINWGVSAPTTGASMAIVHSSALVFSVLAALILLHELVRLLKGELPSHPSEGAAGAEAAARLINEPASAEATR
jgi:TRAP-type C4-dicarboxylate transport system permease small subunit